MAGRRAVRLGFAVILLTAWGGADPSGGASSAALGPIIPITPDKIAGASFGGRRPDVSERGEVVGVAVDEERELVAVAEFDVDRLAEPRRGTAVAVSGDGCVAVVTDTRFIPAKAADVNVLERIDRCDPATGTVSDAPPTTRLLFESADITMEWPALSEDGRYVALQARSEAGSHVVRLDTTRDITEQSFVDGTMPTEGVPAELFDRDRGLDISGDGRVVAATLREPVSTAPDADEANDGDYFIVAWHVGDETTADDVTVVSPTADGVAVDSSGFPSLSSDGRHVAFTSQSPPDGAGDSDEGPWVYARDREGETPVLISPIDGTALYTSISWDATQVAYVALDDCAGTTQATHCRKASAIVVAYTDTPGFVGAIDREIVSTTPAGEIVGEHGEPSLSGNGRWIAWVSDARDQLLGTDDGGREAHAFLRRRDAGLSVDAMKFGEVAPESSADATTVVRNTGRSTVSIDKTTTSSAAFAIVPGGTCVVGATLPPGAFCTIIVRFDSHGLEGAIAATLDVAEIGYDALSASASLEAEVATIPTTSSTTTSSTTATTSPTSTTPTTAPTELAVTLLATPNPVDFGGVAVGIDSAASVVTVENTGTGPGTPSLALGGPDAADFQIVSDTCSGNELAPGARCTVELVAHASGGGPRAGILDVRAGVSAAAVDLRAEAHYSPRIAASPTAVTERDVTMLVGQGFPPGDEVVVNVGSTGLRVTAHTDETGRFRVPFRPLGTLPLGTYVLRADDRPAFYEGPEAALVVVLSTFEPQGPSGPIFGSNVLVTRAR